MLPFNYENLQNIKSIISRKRLNDELEFKIRTYMDGEYKSSISKIYIDNLFKHLESLLSSSLGEEKKSYMPVSRTIEQSKVYNYSASNYKYGDETYRKIKIVSPEPEKTIYNIKKREEDKDFDFYFIILRLSRSLDKEITKEEFEVKTRYVKNIFERLRVRYIFKLNNNIEIHLTKIQLTKDEKKVYEYECEFEINTNDIDEIQSTLEYYLNIMLNVKYLPTRIEVEQLISQYTRLIKHNSPYRNELTNIKLENVKEMKVYNVSNKLDGSQYYLMFSSFSSKPVIYLFNPSAINEQNILDKTNVKSLLIYRYEFSPDLGNTIIAGELTNEILQSSRPGGGSGQIFNAFDTLVYKTQNTTQLNFSKRLSYIDLILLSLAQTSSISIKNSSKEVKLYDNLKIANKPFYGNEILKGKLYFPPSKERENLYFLTLLTISKMNEKYGSEVIKYNDGLVFIPENEPYINFNSKKWKFVQRMTIDFGLILYKDNGNSKIFYLYSGGYDRETKSFKKIPYKIFNKQSKIFNKQAILTVDNTLKEYNELKDDIIVEVKYDYNTQQFVFERIRKDKTYPNSIRVANDVWNDIINPIYLISLLKEMKKYYPLSEDEKKIIDEEKILKIAEMWDGTKEEKKEIIHKPIGKEKCLEQMRKIHNLIKKDLIQNTIGETDKKLVDVIDIGGGKLGDITKYWKTNKINRLYIIEPNKKLLENGKQILNEIINKKILTINAKEKTIFINEPLQNVGPILDTIKNKVDFISAFFSLTFLFGSSYDVDLLVDFIDEKLLPGGYFIGTVMDGTATRKLLDEEKGKINIEHCGYIERKYNPDNPRNFGDKIEVKLSTATVGTQIESLVYFDVLVDKFEKAGIRLVKNELFTNIINELNLNDEFNNLPNDEKLLSSLNRLFIFRKEPEKTRELSMLNKNIILTFDNDIDPDIQLVRVGTLGGGHCFFHSYMWSTNEDYRKANKDEKENMVANLREKVSEELTLDEYEKLTNVGILQFVSKVRKHLVDAKLEQGEKRKRNPNKIPEEQFEPIINEIERSSKNILEYKNALIKELSKDYEGSKGFKEESLNSVFDTILEENMEQYKNELLTCWVNATHIEYLMKKLNINVIMILDTTRKLYPGINQSWYNDKNDYIVMLNIKETHYESCGVLYLDKNNNAFIQYVLYHTESLPMIAKKEEKLQEGGKIIPLAGSGQIISLPPLEKKTFNVGAKPFIPSKDFYIDPWYSDIEKQEIKMVSLDENPKLPILADYKNGKHLPYRQSRGFVLRTRLHLGQWKLGASEMILLLKALKSYNEKVIIVYAGAAPCIHLPLLLSRWPNSIWYLYDPAPFQIDLLEKDKNRVFINYGYVSNDSSPVKFNISEQEKKILFVNNGFFTSDIAKLWHNKCDLFISDIRSGHHDEDEGGIKDEVIWKDMLWQQDWVNIIKPKLAMLKFRAEYRSVNFEYLNGELYLQTYAPKASTECRLITDGKNKTMYNSDLYNNWFYYHNSIRREWEFYPHNVKADGLCHCFDCRFTLYIFEWYLKFINKKPDPISLVIEFNKWKDYLKRDMFKECHAIEPDVAMWDKRKRLIELCGKR